MLLEKDAHRLRELMQRGGNDKADLFLRFNIQITNVFDSMSNQIKTQ